MHLEAGVGPVKTGAGLEPPRPVPGQAAGLLLPAGGKGLSGKPAEVLTVSLGEATDHPKSAASGLHAAPDLFQSDPATPLQLSALATNFLPNQSNKIY